MAEGGHRPDSRMLECPICLEQLRQPKSLPCHHSLCEECLSSYIVSEVSWPTGTATSFTCPVCRNLTHIVDKSEDKEEWAKQFPSDSIAIEMIHLKHSTAESHYCMPCQRRNGSMTPAQFWCKTNQSLFCESCKVDLHDDIHINCDIVDIRGSEHFLPIQDTSVKRCDKHKKKIAYYCEDHKSFGCSKCITVGHRKCEDVSTTEDYCEQLNSNCRLQERMEFLQQGADAMESMVKDFNIELHSIGEDKDTALKSIDDLQERLEKRIAEMKEEITDDLIVVYKEESDNLKVSSQKCERLKVALQNTLKSSGTALQRNDPMGTVMLYQRGQMELEACKNLLKEMRMSISTVSIGHAIDSNVTNVNFGKVVVRKQPRHFPFVSILAQPLSECEVREIRKVNIKCPSDDDDCVARGVVYLPDGRIVVGDQTNNKLKLIDAEGNVVDALMMNGCPWDLCMVDNTTVAAAIENPGGVHVVTITPSKLTLSYVIYVDKPCHGVTYRYGVFIVSAASEICSVMKDGTTDTLGGRTEYVHALSHDSRNVTRHIATDNKVVISRLSTDYKHTNVLKNGAVRYAYGVDVDVEGNVYVCGFGKVLQMSADGTNVRELLTNADGITNTLAISICGNRFVVTNKSSAQRNYIQVFQLV